jgi:antitoxin HicB
LRAIDALETALAVYITDRREIPKPSPAKRRPTVSPTPLAAAKIALYQTMRAQGVTKAALGRRLGWHMPQVDRLLDLAHASRLDQIETALRTLGKTLTVEVHDAA